MRSLPLVLATLLLASCATAPQSAPVAPAAPAPTTPPVAAAPALDPHFAVPATNDGLPGTGPIRRYPWFQNSGRSAAPSGRAKSPRTRAQLFSSATRSRRAGTMTWTASSPS